MMYKFSLSLHLKLVDGIKASIPEYKAGWTIDAYSLNSQQPNIWVCWYGFFCVLWFPPTLSINYRLIGDSKSAPEGVTQSVFLWVCAELMNEWMTVKHIYSKVP